ncbi:hypothetical protein FDP41_002146 [Naegleria fowleri]|uniref:Peptidase C39-like domain-containing protein n=1 Tax=Naegleria fowleri TaxID=5763 RepID=A0A6A5BUZ7_NAEFO|nr:uncharacterized protein FDP41_002146 [Naegleria fowleri]KAF0979076.1 hypothetical protein FDP41_002146 [Naegleria fowleri]
MSVRCQGFHDGLCGIYSVTNAFKHLTKCNQEAEIALFKRMIDSDYFKKSCIYDGLSVKQLADIINDIQPYLTVGAYKVSIQQKNLDVERSDSYFKTLKKLLEENENSVAIIGIEGKINHWTVVYNVTDDQMQVADSGGMKVINRTFCIVSNRNIDNKYNLIPSEVFLVSKMK